MSNWAVKFFGNNSQPSKYIPQNYESNVGGVNRGTPSTGIGKTQYVESETGDRIAFTDPRGYVGIMGSPSTVKQAGYEHKRPPIELCVA